MFYDNFKKICQKQGVSMSSVLDKAQLSRGNLARWKSGITPKLNTVTQISKILNVPVDVLLDVRQDGQTTNHTLSQAVEIIEKSLETHNKEFVDQMVEQMLPDILDHTESDNLCNENIYKVKSDIIKKLKLLNKLGTARAHSYISFLIENGENTTPDEEQTTSEQREKEE